MPRPSTFDEVLRDIRAKSKTTRELGDRFERIILDVLKNDPLYTNRFDGVWMWSEWAANNGISEKHGTGHDLGIDIVARERAGGELCAIQCKCYSDDTILEMGPVNSFISAGTSYGMKNYILACTGPVNSNARAKLLGVKCQMMTKDDLRYRLDWKQYPRKIVRPPPKELRDYQRAAFDDVVKGFRKSDRGKMIMACGTGKTLVSLRVAEKQAGKGGLALYLVPSISLIMQSMREWSENARMPHYYMAVCSDKTVRNSEQGTLTELEAPASTDPPTLRERISKISKDSLNVIFSTYHSVEVVQKALDGREIDVVFCDEAHRTAGVDEPGFESYYTRIHYDRNIRAAKRLYVTATPRIYTERIKGKAEQLEKITISMDDESIYGPEFHNLSFYDAVHKYKALCDFKVRVAVMDGNTMDRLVQKAQAGDEAIMPLDEKTLMASVWHAIRHPGADDSKGMLQRVIMFCDMINSSKIVAGEQINYRKDIREDPEQFEKTREIDKQRSFENVVKHVQKVMGNKDGTKPETKHVDGGDSAQARRGRLEWLKTSEDDPHVCRILSNARCLSEGVDVPALDGVVFMNPRRSVVDVVQAVGRVMRQSDGKEYGYVILPVAIPAGVDIGQALDDSKHFKVVWQVLNALRSHDPNLASEINKLVLTESHTDSEVTNRIIIRHAYSHGLRSAEMPEPKMINGITSKIIQKVGDINYYDKYGEKLGTAANTIEARIQNRIKTNTRAKIEVEKIHADLKEMVGDAVTFNATVQIIAQHIVLSRVFDQLFSGQFTAHNPIAKVLDVVTKKIGMQEELRDLAGFYEDVHYELDRIETREERQNFIKKIYGNFFESADKKGAERHGIVYTPIEVIDFIINSVDVLLRKHFGVRFNDRAVKVLDPFAGTGTFLTRLLESGLIDDNLYEKYEKDLFADELILLAYYIATVNIETTYSSLRRGGRYVPFKGISYTDTLRINPQYREKARHRHEQSMIDSQFRAAHERIRQQRGSHVHVIMGNPPYSAGQSNYNDENQNIDYPESNTRIKDTYMKRSNTANKVSLYDSYIRALRWASDRIGDSGIIAIITNSRFLRSDAGSGIRASLAEEFNEIWCFDLRGDQRTHGETSRQEGGKIFGSGSRAAVAITFLVKNPKKKSCVIRYKDIGDCLSREQKLEIVNDARAINGVERWTIIKPDKYHDWLEQRGDSFTKYTPIGTKAAKLGKDNRVIFRMYSAGIKTHRDEWAYNSSTKELTKNMKRHINYCNSQNLDKPIIDHKRAKWTGTLSERLRRSKPSFAEDKIRIALRKPFFKQHLYFDRVYNESQYQIPRFFPNNNTKNPTICVPYKFRGELSVFITNNTPDLHIIAANQCFPLYIYDNGTKKENITDQILFEYRKHYNDIRITKNDIFYYVYAFLHHPNYKEKFANNLTRELPRIPMAPDFATFRNVGKALSDLHLNFETCERHNLGKPKLNPAEFTRLSFGRKRSKENHTIIRVNGAVLFDKIPETTYRVDGRTPLEWIKDRYKKEIHDEKEIVNDPCTGTDIVAVIERAVHVGLESERIINTLPKEFEPSPEWEPSSDGLDKYTKGDPYQSKI